MAEIFQPQPVKLICAIIARNEDYAAKAAAELENLYGPADVVSESFPFDMTDYYENQMGSGLLRKFLAFERLIDPSGLADIKRATNDIEKKLAVGADVPRPVNLDPGYVALSRLVLASMKDFSHRIYLGGGVYGEITLMYRGGWKTLEWTFPDFASGRYFDFLTRSRNRLSAAIRAKRSEK
ncbi:MAG TPA: DUF4416 family protein [Phycisphaerae bacterium]|nr:DUF4416 family protein [Phycisphaerae bacterium]HPS52896.1 DUF4416 family protein [Phycisphaerae bacterium]